MIECSIENVFYQLVILFSIECLIFFEEIYQFSFIIYLIEKERRFFEKIFGNLFTHSIINYSEEFGIIEKSKPGISKKIIAKMNE